MNRERRYSFYLCIAAMLIVTVTPVASAPTVTVHKWEDHTRPFTIRLTGITLQTPEGILLTPAGCGGCDPTGGVEVFCHCIRRAFSV